MPDPTIEQSRSLSFQDRAHNDQGVSGLPSILWLATQGSIIPPWWSQSRDIKLREFWKKPDHLSGAIYNMESKMVSIPFRIVPRDYSLKRYIREADKYTDILLTGSEFGDGWMNFYNKWIEDYLCQDNGGFFEIIGPGSPTGPLEGGAVAIAHLDAGSCTRTGYPEYPVVYNDPSGKIYKLHYTRVGYSAQMPSPISYMYGVGFCAISRCVNIAQNLLDILVYKQEKLGSRPHRALLITQGGLDPDDVKSAFTLADSRMDSQNLSRYSKIVLVGNQSNPDSDAKLLEFSSLPDGFDEQTSVTLGMATIAMALGVDARELFPAMSAGATRADALLQHIKQRGKGPGQIISAISSTINHKFLPPYLKIEFDYQDDAEDMQVAEIRNVRAQARERDLKDGAYTSRIAREKMLEDREISQEQFERMELEDGRLDDGNSVLTLFYSPDEQIKNLLTFGEVVQDPLDLSSNDAEYMSDAILAQQGKALEAIATSSSEADKWNAQKSLAALRELKALYDEQSQAQFQQESQQLQLQNGQVQANNREAQKKPDKKGGNQEDGESNGASNEERTTNTRSYPTRRENLMRPNTKVELDYHDDLRPNKDDKLTKEEMEIKSIEGYRLNLRAAARAGWSGAYDWSGVYIELLMTIERGYTQAWIEGSGYTYEDLNNEELTRLNEEIAAEQGRASGLADYIESNSKLNKGKLNKVLQRVELWANQYDRVRQLAMTYARKDKRFMWVLGKTKEHCRDCSLLNGRIYRASTWKKYDISPRHWALECRGVKCGCFFQETEEPCTPGRPPTLTNA